MSRVYNFSAGPSTLPPEVLAETQAELTEFGDTGMSLVEMSHRSDEYEAVHGEAAALAREALDVPDDFAVLFLQGGATLQFSMVPMNLAHPGDRAGYVVSGSWAEKALDDARVYADAYAAWGGGPRYDRMPAPGEVAVEPGTRYLHVTSNETIGGIQMWDWPDVDVPLVGDMSSDVMSRPLPWHRFDLVYAGAQKNLGPAGATIVFARDEAIDGARTDLGAYLRYGVHRDKSSLYNTPPVFAIWVIGKTLRWVRDHGGVDAMEAAAREKAGLLYDAIDGSDGFYRSPVDEASRSLMNVVYRLPSEALEDEFLAEADSRGLVNLRGHRSVGGVRASLYNAMPMAGAEALADFMQDFRLRKS